MSHRHPAQQHAGRRAAPASESRSAAKGPPGWVAAPITVRSIPCWIFPVLGTCALLAARPATADLTAPGLPRFLPLHAAHGLEGLGQLAPPGLAQRAIDEEPPKKKPEETPVPEEVKPEEAQAPL